MKTEQLTAWTEAQIREWDAAHVMGTYKRQAPLFVRGEGVRLFDSEGKSYLDFISGIAVNALGHAHPDLAQAIARQSGTLIHVSNLFLTAPMAALAKKLCDLSGFDRVFFCNSGTEANEAALKIARKWAIAAKGTEAFEVVSLTGSFHGRTLGSLALTAQPKYQEPFGPMVPGVRYVQANDLDSLRSAVNPNTAAVFLEPIQGESGVHPISVEFQREARRLCDKFGALLAFDEIQTGMGRTGNWFGFQASGVEPDLFTLAKGLGGGFPIGAVVARGEAATTLVPGDHGSTFAANALASTAAMTVIEVIERDGLLANAAATGRILRQAAERLAPVTEVRGAGLLIGIELNEPKARDVVAACLANGLMINATGDTTLRLAPPLILSAEEARNGAALIAQAVNEVFRG